MADNNEISKNRRWGNFRYAVIGTLLSAPPPRGQLSTELRKLAEKVWQHPITGQDIQFCFSTLEEWYYKIKAEKQDPISPLIKKERKDKGKQHVITEEIVLILKDQYADYPWWDINLHTKNLIATMKMKQSTAKYPSVSSVRRFMKKVGLKRQQRPRQDDKGRLEEILINQEKEIACFEVGSPNDLWSLDFHHGKIMILDYKGNWRQPIIIVVLDHYSRLICHARWSFTETTEDLVCAVSVAIMKHGRPHRFLSDNGSAMRSDEYLQGLERLGIRVSKIKRKKPNQNGKTEVHWANLESKLLAMLVGQDGLTLDYLNELTLAWAEVGYNRQWHREIKMTPLERYLQGVKVGLSTCDEDTLKRAFRLDEFRRPRHSDGTIKIYDILFRLPQRFWHLDRVLVRYARWDLSFVHIVDYASGKEIMKIYPVDKLKNSDGQRRLIETPVEISQERKRTVLPSYMQEMMRQYFELSNKPLWVNTNITIQNEEKETKNGTSTEKSEISVQPEI
ncbi:MAG: DDE-type integrase/transposase/recombinase [Oligoflexales bacterium]|nr:DDE-type integrase/transposase/recombinase [Oligoflexales bacterium]